MMIEARCILHCHSAKIIATVYFLQSLAIAVYSHCCEW